MSKINVDTWEPESGTAMTLGAADSTITVTSGATLGQLHIQTASSGTISPSGNADELVIEGSAHAGMSIYSGVTSTGLINFGDDGHDSPGQIIYDHNDNSFQFVTNTGERFRFASSGQLGIAGATYGSSGEVLTSGGASSPPSWAAAGGGGLDSVQVFTGDDTWTKPAGINKIIVEVQGAGGGGGGGSTSKGDGGGGGGYAKKLLDVSNTTSATVTVGDAGAGGGSAANGGTGGGSLFEENVGTGGWDDVAGNGGNLGQTNNLGGGTGGSASGGNLNIKGGSGGGGTNENNVGGGTPYSGQHYSIGSPNPPTATPGYGGGGEGSRGTTGYSGAAGTDGIVLVWEYK